jgi:hypothetical protein
VGSFEQFERVRQVVMPRRRESPGVIAGRRVRREIYRLGIPLLCAVPIAACIENVGLETCAIEKR